MALVTVKNLSFHYDDKPALKDVSFSLREGEFAVLTGPSGSGKSTLLRILKKEVAPKGRLAGEILIFNRPREELSPRLSAEIGYVMQKPENQIVTARVYHELAFGLENLGFPKEKIESRIGELASFFGIASWFRKDTAELSGGEKQMLALASVMAAGPRLLLLDEPTAELDPIASEQFVALLGRLNQELGITILLVEQRLDSVLKLADKLLVMAAGEIIVQGKPEEVLPRLENPERVALPSAAKIFLGLKGSGPSPLTVREGAEFLNKYSPGIGEFSEKIEFGQRVLKIRNLWFAYEKHSEVFRGADLDVHEGEILTLVGGNGSGKTTLLKLLAGFYPPLQGKIKVFGKSPKAHGNAYYKEMIAYLPQNPQDLFLEETVGKEVDGETLREFALEELAERHPYDLSGGEQQRLALAKVFGKKARLLLLDEPTKALDPQWKGKLLGILKARKAAGVTIVIATHDLDFAARVGDRSGLVFDGRIQSLAPPRAFFTENTFYTTAANRIARRLYPEALTEEEVIELAKKYGERDEEN